MLITYNTAAVPANEAPKKWMDLTDPKWKGRVSIGHPGFSGYVGTWVVQMRKMFGWDYFKKLELNKPRIGRSINDTVTMLNAKESLVAAGPSATTLESKSKGNPLAVVYPEDGAILMVSPTSVLKNAPSPNAGKLFLEYLLSRECNEIQVQHAQDPVNKHVKPMAGGTLHLGSEDGASDLPGDRQGDPRSEGAVPRHLRDLRACGTSIGPSSSGRC